MFDTDPDLIFPLIWCQVCFAAGLLGNGWLLFATIRHRALKLDKISVWTIQNMAAVDLASCFALLLPVIIVQYGILQAEGPKEFNQAFSIYGHTNNTSPNGTNSTNGPEGHYMIQPFAVDWVPTPLCKATAVNEYSFLAGNGALMSVLSVNKLTRCLFPFGNMSPGRMQMAAITLFTGIMIGIPASWELCNYITGAYRAILSTEIQICVMWLGNNAEQSWHFNVMYAIVTICAVIPLTLITVANISLITFTLYTVRGRDIHVRKSGIFLCLGITICLAISYLPTIIYFLPLGYDITLLLDKLRWNFSFLSCWISPVMCFLTNTPFRTATMEQLRWGARGGRTVQIPRRMIGARTRNVDRTGTAV